MKKRVAYVSTEKGSTEKSSIVRSKQKSARALSTSGLTAGSKVGSKAGPKARIMSTQSALARLVQEHRVLNHMSLPQLAELAGLSGAEVQALESGDMSLGLHKIHCISNVLNISPTAILEALDV